VPNIRERIQLLLGTNSYSAWGISKDKDSYRMESVGDVEAAVLQDSKKLRDYIKYKATDYSPQHLSVTTRDGRAISSKNTYKNQDWTEERDNIKKKGINEKNHKVVFHKEEILSTILEKGKPCSGIHLPSSYTIEYYTAQGKTKPTVKEWQDGTSVTELACKNFAIYHNMLVENVKVADVIEINGVSNGLEYWSQLKNYTNNHPVDNSTIAVGPVNTASANATDVTANATNVTANATNVAATANVTTGNNATNKVIKNTNMVRLLIGESDESDDEDDEDDVSNTSELDTNNTSTVFKRSSVAKHERINANTAEKAKDAMDSDATKKCSRTQKVKFVKQHVVPTLSDEELQTLIDGYILNAWGTNPNQEMAGATQIIAWLNDDMNSECSGSSDD